MTAFHGHLRHGTASPVVSRSAGAVVVAAPAKVNLFLELLGKRPDGYHALETLIATTSLCDTLEVAPGDAPGVTIECNDEAVPTDGRNLVAVAASKLGEQIGYALSARVRLTKRVPHAAGLGGGSSDAAAMLVALRELYQLDVPDAVLLAVAAEVGSDVPAFLAGPAAWCAGRGEVVNPVESPVSYALVIVKPPFGLSTALVYRNCQVPAVPTSGAGLLAAWRSGDPRELASAVMNRLGEVAEALEPGLAAVRKALLNAGGLVATVSGSGSSVFAVALDEGHAREVASRIQPLGLGSVFVTRTAVVRGGVRGF